MTIRDECGVIGVHGEEAARAAILGLHALQHRGQESAGVATFDGIPHLHKGMGLVEHVFAPLPDLPGEWAIGHNRYSTSGTSVAASAGPFLVETDLGPLALAHNGNIVNAGAIRQRLADDHGLTPVSDSDSELLALLLAVAPGESWPVRIRWMAERALGAYALVLLTESGLFGVRDPMGIRPLALGRTAGGWVLASESCAFAVLGGRHVRELEPGEILSLTPNGPAPAGQLPAMPRAFCAFESIYLSRPDTVYGGRTVHATRRAMGEQLALEYPVEADLVVGVPDSGTSAALGYAAQSGIPFGEGLIKNRYIARTFIQPDQTERERLIRMKFAPLPLRGKRVVLVDDSVVRGNTLGPIVALLRGAEAREVHVRVACPPLTHPCYLGVDMASPGEFIANRVPPEAMAAYVGADSLGYLSVSGLLRAVHGSTDDHCLACFTGRYPIPLLDSAVGTPEPALQELAP
ncbi:MAG TPA: amidophosphoribosyltransferase [Chloroflexota bacterium]|nr:amidophosphoribosyltransferase [Chloroflexota bacterium]